MSSTSQATDNKRAFIRLKLNSKILLQKLGDSATYEGTCVDMSGVGLMVASSAPLQVDDKVIAKIEAKGSEIVYHTTVKRLVEENGEQRIALSIDEILD